MSQAPTTFSATDQAYIATAIANATASQYGDINAGFTLNSAYLVFFMHTGFAMLRYVTLDS